MLFRWAQHSDCFYYAQQEHICNMFTLYMNYIRLQLMWGNFTGSLWFHFNLVTLKIRRQLFRVTMWIQIFPLIPCPSYLLSLSNRLMLSCIDLVPIMLYKIKITLLGQSLHFVKNLKFSKQIKTPEKVFHWDLS